MLSPTVLRGLLAGAATLFAVGAFAQFPASPLAAAPPTLFAVGDIAHCGSLHTADATGRLMEHLLDTTPNSRGITLGDNSNDDGSEESYDCLHRTAWGRLMPRLYPTPGNHDYQANRELPFYFLYFINAGPLAGDGYYAYDFGGWRIYALNSELMSDPEKRAAQLHWLERDLRAHSRVQCSVAYFHRPPFSSGRFASPAWVMPIFRRLYRYGVDVVVTGHEHFFSYVPPLTPDGVHDAAYGVPTLIAGTGGAVFFEQPKTLRYGGGEVVLSNTLGVAQLTLRPRTFDWAFVRVDGRPGPAGSGTCHDNPAGVTIG